MLTMLWINKYRLLTDHTFRNGYSTVKIIAPDFYLESDSYEVPIGYTVT